MPTSPCTITTISNFESSRSFRWCIFKNKRRASADWSWALHRFDLAPKTLALHQNTSVPLETLSISLCLLDESESFSSRDAAEFSLSPKVFVEYNRKRIHFKKERRIDSCIHLMSNIICLIMRNRSAHLIWQPSLISLHQNKDIKRDHIKRDVLSSTERNGYLCELTSWTRDKFQWHPISRSKN